MDFFLGVQLHFTIGRAEAVVQPHAEIFPSAVRFLRSFLTSNLGALFDFWANEKGTGLGS